ncbi:hypothetical protein OKW76_03460 [Sphingomonas sp. S1-29]|uniref:hypothetical protein n=1 Tax=Sphingomonas sp. S1-29 TaxID=2991074 RepID=UPI0022406D39|nr:hypothetical protein [Sphingomonas sp. S1-29]UZK70123.1 hypothetical protein OKW76_03460 [Sphingomonas sp. S1-29]
MVDNTNGSQPTGFEPPKPTAPTDTVSFQPAPKLETAGNVDFDAASEMGSSEAKRTAAETIKEEASKLGSQAADKARSFAGDGKAKASGALDEFSRMMSDAADTVDEKLGAQYGQYARSAADQIGGFAETLRDKEVDELLDDARVFVRKSPAIAIGTAAALGFVLARIIKAGVDGVADASDPTVGGTPRA